ncbi:MAG: glutathione S-transferase family protein [Marinomonas sp.]|uniref:glutathione S-transferase family protein n=1 Tax=Shimia sp. TaxID=1954381 RepID=UPI00329A6CB8
MKLITFHGDDKLPSFSPFCLKAMCLLEMAGQEWEPEYIQDLSTMPLGRVPVLRLQDELIPDSHHIQEHLERNGFDFNPGLTASDKATSHALVRMTEESLRLGLVHDRWLDEKVWPEMRGSFFAAVPDQMRNEVAAQVQDQVRAGLTSHGIAQFQPDDRVRRLNKDMIALEHQLSGKAFLFGDEPSAADATIAPVLDMILGLPAPTALRAAAESFHVFAPYVSRTREAIYPPMERFSAGASAAAE